MRPPVLAVHIGKSVQPLKWNLDGDTSLFWSLAEWSLVGWWWIINNAIWRKILPPFDSLHFAPWAVLSVLLDFFLEQRWELCVERAEEATALILNSSLLCLDFGFSGSQPSASCPQSFAWIYFLILCTTLSASVWPELCWLKFGSHRLSLKMSPAEKPFQQMIHPSYYCDSGTIN